MSSDDPKPPAPPSNRRPPRTIEVDGARYTFAEYVAHLEAQGIGPSVVEVAASAFGVGDLIVVGEDGRPRYEHSGLLAD